jgi:hypothetical protein
MSGTSCTFRFLATITNEHRKRIAYLCPLRKLIASTVRPPETTAVCPFIDGPEGILLASCCRSRRLEGYDVVTFSVQTSPECSPLSCNNLAEGIRVNPHCLLSTFDEAKGHLEAGLFDGSEPGPYRIFAVYTIPENFGLVTGG